MTSKARKSTTEANSQIHCYTTQMVSLTTLIGQALAVLTQAPKHSSSPKTTAHRWGSTHPHIQSLRCTVNRKHRKCYIGVIYVYPTHAHLGLHHREAIQCCIMWLARSLPPYTDIKVCSRYVYGCTQSH